MIIHTLLSTYADRDLNNVLLTSTVIYYVIYCMLPEQYNYLLLSAIVLLDLYFVKYRREDIGNSGGHKHQQKRHHRVRQSAPKAIPAWDRSRTVRFDPEPPQIYNYQPYPSMNALPQDVRDQINIQHIDISKPPAEEFPIIDNRHLVPVEEPVERFEEPALTMSDNMTFVSGVY